jgi:hypothetical protein
MPFRYKAAPLLIDGTGCSDFCCIKGMIRAVDRTTWPGRFSSRFRSRRTPLPEEVAEELCSVYSHARQSAEPSSIASSYEQALPCLPNTVDPNRWQTYQTLLKDAQAETSETSRNRCCVPRPRRSCSTTPTGRD